jgi:FkbM family methyltransferase
MNAMDWFGAKRIVKDVLQLRPINAALVSALRRLPVTSELARMPVSVPEVEGHAADVRYVLTHPARCSIAKELFWGRGRRIKRDEQQTLELFARLARRTDVVFDIGANTGVFSVIAALANAAVRVDAFEIVPEVYEILFQNVLRNDIARQVTCRFCGVHKEGFTTRIPRSTMLSSLPLSFSAEMDTPEGVHVPFRSLDDLCKRLSNQTRLLMKIDVEATEAVVFAHGWDSIARVRPWMVCEILADAAGTSEIDAGLRERGYHFYKITDDALVAEDHVVADLRYHDWLFAPAGRDEVAHACGVPVKVVPADLHER